MRNQRIAVSFLALVSAASLSAHETWLAPNQGFIAVGLPVRLDMTSGGSFPILETAIDADRLANYGVRLGSEILKPTFTPGPHSLRFALTPPKEKEGFATAFVSLKPKKLNLTAAQVAEYLDEIGQAEKFLEKWKARPEPRTWREEYTKHAKAYFRVGKTTGDDSWKTPAGLSLELLPLTDPSHGSTLEPFQVQLLKDGKPLAGLSVVALVDAKTPRAVSTTDADGRASFKLDRPGRWLLEATYLRETTKPGLDFESDFTTMLVTVTPPRPAAAATPAAKPPAKT